MKTFYYECDRGASLTKAKSIDEARREIKLDIGRVDEIRVLREATEDDIAWISKMGGRIP